MVCEATFGEMLLKLVDRPEAWTVRSLAAALGLDPAGVHRALERLSEVRLMDLERRGSIS
jgi:DNA-binding IclR family transcriptional regulator